MTKAETEECYAITLRLAEDFFSRRCGACHGLCKTGKHFVIHHKKYLKGEKTRQDFEKRVEYLRYLEKLINKKTHSQIKEQFELLHNAHHSTITKLRRFKDNQTIIRIARITLDTEYTSGRPH